MKIILLSGGSGKRLWPLSNDIRSKQFIKFLRTENGERESMIQRVFKQIKTVDPDASVLIATSKSQISALHNQLGENIDISIEPCRKDTFPAIVLASLYFRDILNCDENEPVIVCPVDPYVTDEYFLMLRKMSEQVALGQSNMVLMGITPRYPSEKFGYIIPQTADFLSNVASFKEKPNLSKAKECIKQGALWNGGVFAFKLKFILDKAKEILNVDSYNQLYERYETLQKVSFDYAVAEKEKSIQVMRYDGEWRDIGAWNTLTEVMQETVIGDGTLDISAENVHIINELDIPVMAIGVNNVVVAASPDGILVADKEHSGQIKSYVEAVERDVRYAEKSWGCFKIIDVERESLTIKVTIQPGDKMNYHSHKNRDEIWVVIAGMGRTTIDGITKDISVGDIIKMPKNCRHTVCAVTELQLIEVQLGIDIQVGDKQKFDLENH